MADDLDNEPEVASKKISRREALMMLGKSFAAITVGTLASSCMYLIGYSKYCNGSGQNYTSDYSYCDYNNYSDSYSYSDYSDYSNYSNYSKYCNGAYMSYTSSYTYCNYSNYSDV